MTWKCGVPQTAENWPDWGGGPRDAKSLRLIIGALKGLLSPKPSWGGTFDPGKHQTQRSKPTPQRKNDAQSKSCDAGTRKRRNEKAGHKTELDHSSAKVRDFPSLGRHPQKFEVTADPDRS